jgi:DMSO/TMAO reductase YedYZ molybdopterin-dependent catalytic subunit
MEIQRRDFLLKTGAAGLLLMNNPTGASALEQDGGEVVAWSDHPDPVPAEIASGIKNLTRWEDLNTRITPTNKFFSVNHYNWPILDAAKWQLKVTGQVDKPLTLTLADLKARPRQNVTFTLECSGNNGFPFFTSAVGTAEWGGTSLADILSATGIRRNALEIAFFGADKGPEVIHAGTPIEHKFSGTFARSMSVDDAMNPANILCYEMNGEALSTDHGAPVRLIVPGWFGIANVKWLTRIDVRDKRLMNRFMGRDYVTVREEQHDGETVSVESSVGRNLLKSAPSRVVKTGDSYRIDGMAWGGPNSIAAVEVKIDDGPWTKAELEGSQSPYEWRIWHVEWSPKPGEHTVTSRAIDTAGTVQPAIDEPLIANKKTYWESNGQITRRVQIM